MHTIKEPELTVKIRVFIDRKTAQFPELRWEPRLLHHSAVVGRRRPFIAM